MSKLSQRILAPVGSEPPRLHRFGAKTVNQSRNGEKSDGSLSRNGNERARILSGTWLLQGIWSRAPGSRPSFGRYPGIATQAPRNYEFTQPERQNPERVPTQRDLASTFRYALSK